ncbi:MAG: ABC transporter ATP-binding protein [Alphaproteobacteria bacterium]|nr:ABC transporter ATP-binding protein [Alphaproteobacteria bacterium]
MSSETAIRVENLGKRYQLNKRTSVDRFSRIRRHFSEFLPFLSDDEDNAFWALEDVCFEVKEGDILGILGRNGSGKSTLLKILAGVTQPTTGRAEIRGRLGSLLEVGTGFHPDMTGRENVFMAGALLGLKQSEIRAKFDSIVDFSGIEKFIDMPVKRYSSGMYVRLAYSVASMLRSDILILDEVMAVGDAAFLEKSQKNIETIANEGRTILFVSHNARAIKSICRSGMILENGRMIFEGSADDAITSYMRSLHHINESSSDTKSYAEILDAPRLVDGSPVIHWVEVLDGSGQPSTILRTGEPATIRIGFKNAQAQKPYFSVLVMNEFAERVATLHSTHPGEHLLPMAEGVIECRVEDLRIGEGDYWLMIDHGHFGGSRAATFSYDCVPNATRISVKLEDWVLGVGLDAYQGAAIRSRWQYLEK